MSTTLQSAAGGLRIVGALAAKDVMDAIKNRTTLSTLIMAVLMMLMYKALPALGRAASHHDIYVYDAGNSGLLNALEGGSQYRVNRATSLEHLREMMSGADQGELGLVVPADLDQVLQSGAEPELGAYVTWADRSSASSLALSLRQDLVGLLGHPVRISTDGNIVYPEPNSMGTARMVAATVAMILFIVGPILVPQLMLEEREAKTLDVLMVSPASTSQLVAGKALAGIFYCLVAGGTLLALNLPFVAHWGLAAVTVGVGALCSVALGLLMGTIFETRQQMASWVFVILNIFLVPAILDAIAPLLPEAIRPVLTWAPSVATAMLIRMSFSSVMPAAEVIFRLAIVAGSTVLLLGLTTWRLRRWDR